MLRRHDKLVPCSMSYPQQTLTSHTTHALPLHPITNVPMQYRGDARLGFYRRWTEAAGNATIDADSMYLIETLLHEHMLQVNPWTSLI
jgi:hypothetical protein